MASKIASTKARRVLMAVVVVGLLAAGAWASPHASAQPEPPVPISGSFTLEDICAFDVRIDFDGKAGVVVLPNGTVIVTSPGLKATVTNLEDGNQVSLSIPGPVSMLPSGEAVFLGPSLVIRSAQFGDNTEALVYTTGRFTFLAGRVPPFSGVGRLTDICAALT